MCGIAGILNYHGERTDLEDRLRSLQRALHHRGPDDAGLWMSPEQQVGLVHTRLSILDLSSAGHQPMISADGRFTLCFNGEIYNFLELRAELERQGVTFHTRTDTEVLLHLYQREGRAMLKHLRGMFAFCLWDSLEQCALLARDPFGIKPLYYRYQDGELAFASELKALREAGFAGRGIDPVAVMAYLESGSVPEPMTLFQNLRCLPAGHCLELRAGRMLISAYWQPSFGAEIMPEVEAAAMTRAALIDSVQHHFVSDVPVGLFLSGGMDSTALLALAQQTGHKGLQTFSIAVDDAALDESHVAARTAAHFGAEHHELRLDAAQVAASFPAFLQAMDQPSVDGFNTFTVAGFARQAGMKVVLSGLGGDELLGGYPSFQKVPKLAALAQAFGHVPGHHGAGMLLERFAPSRPLRRVGSLFQRPPSLLNAWRCFRGIFTARDARLLAARYTGVSTTDIPEPILSLPVDPQDQVSLLELSLYMRHQLLKDSDVMSMAHGLELRVPLVDRVLFEAVSRLPAAQRLQPGKRLLAQAVPELPLWVTQAPKRGFSFPFESWLRAEWGTRFAEVARQLPDSHPRWYQLWCVFMLERWLEK